ncbi:MAG: DUF362 domain-containing protein, partial [Candidatus Woesearchaeota archaeon]
MQKNINWFSIYVKMSDYANMSEVYFLSIKTKEFVEGIGRLFDKALEGIVKKGDLVAVKVHFGERGNTSFIRPEFLKPVIEKIKEKGGKPFLTDTNTLYVGHRGNSVDHFYTALLHGFGALQTPIIIADGLTGKSSIDIDIKGILLKKVKIGLDIVNADSMIVISHVKGHMATGMGGAIKNTGMGCASRAGKQHQHSSTKPIVNKKLCTACKICSRWCSVNAISYNSGKASIDHGLCVGCGECTVSCPSGALEIRWDTSTQDLQAKMAEYALGAVMNKRVGYINFLINIVPDCDCWNKSDNAIVPDIGALASKDIVAIDKASFDLVNSSKGIKTNRL